MIVGPVGSGKTQLYRQLPGRKFAYLFDPNAVDAIKGDPDIDFVEFIPDVTDLDLAVKTLKKDALDRSRRDIKPKTYVEWEADWDERYAAGFFNQYDWIIFDSATTFSEIIMDRVQSLNGRLGKHPEQADYTAEMSVMKSVFRAATSITGVVVTVHTEMDQDELTRKVYGRLLLTGRNRTRIPGRFAHILGTKVDKNSKGETRYYCLTKQNREYPALRTSIRDIEEEIDVTIDYNKQIAGQGIGKYFTVTTNKKV
jgi:hypothetical protein